MKVKKKVVNRSLGAHGCRIEKKMGVAILGCWYEEPVGSKAGKRKSARDRWLAR